MSSGERGDSDGPRRGADALDFGDPLDGRAADDTDLGWGDRAAPPAGAGQDAEELRRFLEEKPPHHL